MTDVRTVPTVSYDAASRVVAAAAERAAAEGIAVCIAVTDPGGNLVAFGRMDGAPLLSAKIAEDKAYSVSAFKGVPTGNWYGMIKDNPALLTGIVHRDRLVVFGGGVPLTVEGQLVGAVGVSGGSAEQDELCAEAGAKALSGN
ncbi:MAG TPA: heme-binding protein [Kineosporiaceae bacterium]|nr:heme-binding protein [Kineosporiaceae bacterium]